MTCQRLCLLNISFFSSIFFYDSCYSTTCIPDGNINIHDLPTVTFRGQISKAKGCHLYSIFQDDDGMYTMTTSTIRLIIRLCCCTTGCFPVILLLLFSGIISLCAAVKRKLIIFRLEGREFVEVKVRL